MRSFWKLSGSFLVPATFAAFLNSCEGAKSGGPAGKADSGSENNTNEANSKSDMPLALQVLNNAIFTKGLLGHVSVFGVFKDGTTQNIVDQIIFAVKDPSIISINEQGQINPIKSGTTDLKISLKAKLDISASVQIVVSESELVALSISQTKFEGPVGRKFPVEIKGILSDKSVTELGSLKYEIADSGVAVIQEQSGTRVLSLLAPGETTLKVSSGSVSIAAKIIVSKASLDKIILVPSEVTLAAGLSDKVEAFKVYSDGTKLPLVDGVEWSAGLTTEEKALCQNSITLSPWSSNTQAAAFVNSTKAGSCKIYVKFGELVGESHVSVGSAIPKDLSVEGYGNGSEITFYESGWTTFQLRPYVIFSDGSKKLDMSATVTFNAALVSVVKTASDFYVTPIPPFSSMSPPKQIVSTDIVIGASGMTKTTTIKYVPKFVKFLNLDMPYKIPVDYYAPYFVLESPDSENDSPYYQFGRSAVNGEVVCAIAKDKNIYTNDSSVDFHTRENGRGLFKISAAGNYFLNCSMTLLDNRTGVLAPFVVERSRPIEAVGDLKSELIVKEPSASNPEVRTFAKLSDGVQVRVPACVYAGPTSKFSTKGESCWDRTGDTNDGSSFNRTSPILPEIRNPDRYVIGEYVFAANGKYVSNIIKVDPPFNPDISAEMALGFNGNALRMNEEMTLMPKFSRNLSPGAATPTMEVIRLYNIGKIEVSPSEGAEETSWGVFKFSAAGSYLLSYTYQGKTVTIPATVSQTVPAFVRKLSASTSCVQEASKVNLAGNWSQYSQSPISDGKRYLQFSDAYARSNYANLDGILLFDRFNGSNNGTNTFFFRPSKATYSDKSPLEFDTGFIFGGGLLDDRGTSFDFTPSIFMYAGQYNDVLTRPNGLAICYKISD